MRTFTCFTHDASSSVPTLSFIIARDEGRARELARRELMDALRPVGVELHEAGRLLWSEVAERGAPLRAALQRSERGAAFGSRAWVRDQARCA